MTRNSILVTGASGYIGRHVVTRLLDSGAKVVAVDMVNRNLPKNAEFVCGDILGDLNFVSTLPRCGTVLHLAWQDGFVHNAPSHLANLHRHFNFVKAMVERGADHVAVMGTMHEVGYWEGAIDETTPCNPLSMYGVAKNALRQALAIEFQNKSVVFQWLRGFYIYGDDHFNHSIFTKLLQAAESGQASFPFTSGKNKYDFLHVDELAERIVATILQSDIDGIVNCCSGKPVSLAEAVEKFIEHNKLKIRLDYGAFPDRPYDSPGIWGDASKIDKILAKGRHA